MPAHSVIICKWWEGAAKAKLGISEAMPGSLEEGAGVSVSVSAGVGGATGVSVGGGVGVGGVFSSKTITNSTASGLLSLLVGGDRRMLAHLAIVCKGWEGAAEAKLGISEATPGSLEEDDAVAVGVSVGVAVAVAVPVGVGVDVGVGIVSSTVI